VAITLVVGFPGQPVVPSAVGAAFPPVPGVAAARVQESTQVLNEVLYPSAHASSTWNKLYRQLLHFF